MKVKRPEKFPLWFRFQGNWPLQTQIVLLVISVVIFSVSVLAFFAIRTISLNIEDMNGDKVLALAKVVSEMPEIKAAFSQPDPAKTIQPLAERIRQQSKVQFVVILNMHGYRYSHPRPDLVGKHFTGGDEGPALRGQTYLSRAVGISGPSLRAFVPIRASDGAQLGVAVVGMFRQGLTESIAEVRNPLYLATLISLLVGVVGAVMLAKNVKRTIFGLEPIEIATLLEEREAIFHSVREGIVAINKDKQITLLNDAGKRLLGIAEDVVGKPVSEAVPNTRLPEVLETGKAQYDQEQVFNETIVLTNRVPIIVRGKVVGAVATFRDKTEVKRLAEELTGVKKFVEGLRAQTHEFMNKLHTISGLIQLGAHEEATAFISDMVRNKQNIVGFLMKRVKDPATAGLLLGRISQAEERGVEVIVDPRTSLGPLPKHFDGSSLVMVLGNLMENAVEAVQKLPRERRRVAVSLRETPDKIRIRVSDMGDGIPPEIIDRVFERGFTTKQGNFGIGLALVKQRTNLVGGDVRVRSVPRKGTTFVVTIPKELSRPLSARA